jgi:uncharacterized membrane protein
LNQVKIGTSGQAIQDLAGQLSQIRVCGPVWIDIKRRDATNQFGKCDFFRVMPLSSKMPINSRYKSICMHVLLAAGVAAGLVPLSATPASADFRVCNATQELVGVAIGYRARSGWITEGWWAIEGSTCKTLIEGPLESRYYYIYAEDGVRGGRWDGPISMCIAELQFKITGVNDCYARGFQKAGFREYDTGNQTNWMVQLVDDPEPDVGGAPGQPVITQQGEGQ